MDILERLNNQTRDDHARGCEGRCYSCSCGYDSQTDAVIAAAISEITRLRKLIETQS